MFDCVTHTSLNPLIDIKFCNAWLWNCYDSTFFPPFFVSIFLKKNFAFIVLPSLLLFNFLVSLSIGFSFTAFFTCTDANNVQKCVAIADIPFQNILIKKSEVGSLKSEVWSLKSNAWSMKLEVGTRNSEVRRRKSGVSSLWSNICSPKSKVQSPKSKVRSLKSEVRGLISEVESRKSEVGSPHLEVASRPR